MEPEETAIRNSLKINVTGPSVFLPHRQRDMLHVKVKLPENYSLVPALWNLKDLGLVSSSDHQTVKVAVWMASSRWQREKWKLCGGRVKWRGSTDSVGSMRTPPWRSRLVQETGSQTSTSQADPEA